VDGRSVDGNGGSAAPQPRRRQRIARRRVSAYPSAVPPLGSSPASRWRWPALLLLAGVALAGALALSFQCDDAYITFRYVRNAYEGHGLVWNRAPFLPVEGYTGFLWALLLWGCWQVFGVEPPDAANVLSVAFGMVEFAVLAAAALRLRRRDGNRAGDGVAVLALATIVANRSFLQWFTGGLETALFNLAFVGWALLGFVRVHDHRTLTLWSTAAAVAALTRPDGLLLAAATVGAAYVVQARRKLPWRTLAVGLAPLLLVVAHVAWRRAFYGEWLPNTYFAKITSPWPEAGLRYLACFAVEHGAWIPALLAPVWFVVEIARVEFFPVRILHRPAALAVVGVCLFHAGYYVLRVGGDHFEYRVLSQHAPLLVLATAAMALRLADGTRLAVVALAALLLASSAGWAHLWLSRDLPPHGFVRLAPQVPAALQPLACWFDRQQGWLLFQNVGVRAPHHGAMLEREFWKPFPGRVVPRIATSSDDPPVMGVRGAGVMGWALPDVSLLDEHGLNDWVVARTPVRGSGPVLSREFLAPVIAAADTTKDGWFDEAEMRAALAALSGGGDAAAASQPADYFVHVLLAVFAHHRLDALTMDEAAQIADLLQNARAMAHERHAPPGYVASFRPNVGIVDGKAAISARSEPLTADEVRRLEAEWRAKARNGLLLK
jgi:arabinofuranosyltransferase